MLLGSTTSISNAKLRRQYNLGVVHVTGDSEVSLTQVSRSQVSLTQVSLSSLTLELENNPTIIKSVMEKLTEVFPCVASSLTHLTIKGKLCIYVVWNVFNNIIRVKCSLCSIVITTMHISALTIFTWRLQHHPLKEIFVHIPLTEAAVVSPKILLTITSLTSLTLSGHTTLSGFTLPSLPPPFLPHYPQ